MNRTMKLGPLWVAAIAGATVFCAVSSAQASSLTADGITYTLDETVISPTEDSFTLIITGINSTSDTEGGRYGVNSLAFTESPQGSVTNATLSGFTFMSGGLNAMGCDGTGNFFCFKANTAPKAPALPANSTLDFTFDVFVSKAGDLSGYDPDFKVQWLGTKNHYDLVSEQLDPTVVPLPPGLPLLLGGIGFLGFMTRRSRAA